MGKNTDCYSNHVDSPTDLLFFSKPIFLYLFSSNLLDYAHSIWAGFAGLFLNRAFFSGATWWYHNNTFFKSLVRRLVAFPFPRGCIYWKGGSWKSQAKQIWNANGMNLRKKLKAQLTGELQIDFFFRAVTAENNRLRGNSPKWPKQIEQNVPLTKYLPTSYLRVIHTKYPNVQYTVLHQVNEHFGKTLEVWLLLLTHLVFWIVMGIELFR